MTTSSSNIKIDTKKVDFPDNSMFHYWFGSIDDEFEGDWKKTIIDDEGPHKETPFNLDRTKTMYFQGETWNYMWMRALAWSSKYSEDNGITFYPSKYGTWKIYRVNPLPGGGFEYYQCDYYTEYKFEDCGGLGPFLILYKDVPEYYEGTTLEVWLDTEMYYCPCNIKAAAAVPNIMTIETTYGLNNPRTEHIPFGSTGGSYGLFLSQSYAQYRIKPNASFLQSGEVLTYTIEAHSFGLKNSAGIWESWVESPRTSRLTPYPPYTNTLSNYIPINLSLHEDPDSGREIDLENLKNSPGESVDGYVSVRINSNKPEKSVFHNIYLKLYFSYDEYDK